MLPPLSSFLLAPLSFSLSLTHSRLVRSPSPSRQSSSTRLPPLEKKGKKERKKKRELGLHFSKEPTHPRAWTMGRDAPLDGRQRPFFFRHTRSSAWTCASPTGECTVSSLSLSVSFPLSSTPFPLLSLFPFQREFSSRVSDFLFKRATTTSRPLPLSYSRAFRHRKQFSARHPTARGRVYSPLLPP